MSCSSFMVTTGEAHTQTAKSEDQQVRAIQKVPARLFGLYPGPTGQSLSSLTVADPAASPSLGSPGPSAWLRAGMKTTWK